MVRLEGLSLRNIQPRYAPNTVSSGIIKLTSGAEIYRGPRVIRANAMVTTKPPKIKNGMVFCLEPMVCQKSGQPMVLDDKWSVVSDDRLRSAHYEHQVAVVDGKAVILTEA